MEGLNKKLAEWAGFTYQEENGYHYRGWAYTDNDRQTKRYISELDFPNDLNACFKWLVPKAIEVLNRDFNWDEKGCLNRIFKDWQRIYWNGKGTLSYALALCKAIEKLIDGGT